MTNRKKIIIGISIVAIALVGWLVVQKISSSRGSEFRNAAAPIAVDLAEIEKSSIQDTGNFTGTIIPRSQFVVAPKVSGRLEKLRVNIGDWVQRGQLLAILDDEEYNQQVHQAQADLQVAQANLEESKSSLDVAERELKRVLELHQKGISADSELDAAKGNFAAQEARYKVAMAQVANREAALEAANIRLSYTQIKASWDEGADKRVVGERFVYEGALLTANAPILSILEINPVLAVIYITDKDYFRVEKGQTAVISSNALPNKPMYGKIERIAPLLQETSRSARIEIKIQNDEGLLKPGMFVNIQIEYKAIADATVVPMSSIVNRDNQQGIFLADIENKVANFVPVKVGISSNEVTEIIDPSSLSGYVVVLGQHLLANGSPIIIPPAFLPAGKQSEK
ncbi:MAG: efflux RND transporter periplasmic adaptor subunit [Candidatus Aminicenantes bacterium]|nr:efflux RND transporter periplasmic adaptor subunit [Candidatus Aminicenantes bacterium]